MRFVFLFACLLIVLWGRSQNVNGIVVNDFGNLKYVKVWGSHYERGYACGYLMPEEIKAIFTGYIIPEFGSYLSAAKGIVSQGSHIVYDQKYISEAQGMIDGATAAGMDMPGVDYLDILVANAYLDLRGFGAFKTLEGNGCSSLMSWGNATLNTDLAGGAVISRHLDWADDTAIVNNQAIIVHFPSEPDEQPWAMVGFAGQIGALSGFNSSGLSVFQHQMADFSGNGSLNMAYEPIWMSLRKSLEQIDYNGDGVTSVQDVKQTIQENVNGYADGFIVAALAPANFEEDSLISMVAELAPQAPKITFRSTEYPDSMPNDNLYAANYEIKRNDHVHLCNRYNAVIAAIGLGKGMSSTANWELMRDYSNSSWSNIQFMQVVPGEGYFNFSYHNGTDAAYLNDSIRFYFTELFDNPVSISKVSKGELQLQVFPNPFSQSTSISFLNPSNSTFSIYLSDYRGKVVLEQHNISGQGYIIHRENLARGMYILRLERDDGVKASVKLMMY